MHTRFFRNCLIGVVTLSISCQSPEDTPGSATGEIGPDSDQTAIVQHLLEAEQEKRNTTAMARHFPAMDRQAAYDIQNAILAIKNKDERQIGWKIGYSRAEDESVILDPIFGHMMTSNVIKSGEPISAVQVTGDSAVVEGEFVFYLEKDLLGPNVTRDDVIDAVNGVAGVIEILASWTQAPEGMPYNRNHDIAGNVFHVGAIFGKKRVTLDEIDFSKETVTAVVNGEEKVSGKAVWTMRKDPIEAVVWLANELIKYSPYTLKAGDVVITGTVFSPPRIAVGGKAVMKYSTLGEIEVEMVP